MCNWNGTHSPVTQDAACEPNGKPASFWGFSLFFGGPVSGLMGGDGKMKRKREGGFSPTMIVFCNLNFTVKSFPGIIVGGIKRDGGLLQTLCCDSMCGFLDGSIHYV